MAELMIFFMVSIYNAQIKFIKVYNAQIKFINANAHSTIFITLIALSINFLHATNHRGC